MIKIGLAGGAIGRGGRSPVTDVKITIFSFSCDQPGCREVVEITPDPPYLSYAARQLREREGWATGQGKYFCPAHKRSPGRPW